MFHQVGLVGYGRFGYDRIGEAAPSNPTLQENFLESGHIL